MPGTIDRSARPTASKRFAGLGADLVEERRDEFPVHADVEHVRRGLLHPHRSSWLQVVRAPVQEFVADILQPRIAVAGQTPVGEDGVILPQRLLTGLDGLPVSPNAKAVPVPLDRRRGVFPLAARLRELRQVLVLDPKFARREVHLRLHAIPIVAPSARGDIRLQGEGSGALPEQRRPPPGAEMEGVQGVSAQRLEGVGQRTLVPDPRKRLDGLEEVALPGRVGAKQHRELRQLDRNAGQGPELPNREFLEQSDFPWWSVLRPHDGAETRRPVPGGTEHNVPVILRPILAVRRHASAHGLAFLPGGAGSRSAGQGDGMIGTDEVRPGGVMIQQLDGELGRDRPAAEGSGDEQTGLLGVDAVGATS